MTFEITCIKCSCVLYSGYELKPAREVLKMKQGRCSSCNAQLASSEFTLEVEKQFT